jgi:DNA-binding MarR family transcriptional regulator
LEEENSFFSDNEYSVLSEIMENGNITQRELSSKLGVSVSTVNGLMSKMIKEGLVKMTQVSQKQFFYMLTPLGMMEKAKKTVRYMKIHYRAIYEIKENIKYIFVKLDKCYDEIFILIDNDETDEIMSTVIDDALNNQQHTDKIKIVNEVKAIEVMKNADSQVLVHMSVNEYIIKEINSIEGVDIVNLTEML